MYIKGLRAQVSPFAMMTREGEGQAAGGGVTTQGQATQTLPTQGQTGGTTENNGGNNDFDVSGFWNKPAPEGTTTPQQGQPPAQQQGQTQQPSHVDAIKARVQRDMAAVQVDAGRMIQDFNEGKVDSLQAYIQKSTEQAVTSAVEMAAQMIQGAQARMREQMQAQIGGTLSRRDAEAHLGQQFPWAMEDGFKEMTTAVFNQAMSRNKNNAKKALEESAAYLRTMQKKIGATNTGGQNNSGFGGNAGAMNPAAGADTDWAALLSDTLG